MQPRGPYAGINHRTVSKKAETGKTSLASTGQVYCSPRLTGRENFNDQQSAMAAAEVCRIFLGGCSNGSHLQLPALIVRHYLDELKKNNPAVSEMLGEEFVLIFYDTASQKGSVVSCQASPEYRVVLNAEANESAHNMVQGRTAAVIEGILAYIDTATLILLWHVMEGFGVGAALVRKTDIDWAERELNWKPENFVLRYKRFLDRTSVLLGEDRSGNVSVSIDATMFRALTVRRLDRYSEKHCAGCMVEGEGFKQCSGCYKARYCGASCQKENWKKHRDECRLRARLQKGWATVWQGGRPEL